MISNDFEKLMKIKKGAIHIGGHEAGECSWYEQMGFNKTMWFEPDPDVFKILQNNIKQYPNQVGYNVGIYNKTMQTILHVASNGGQSSSILNFKLHKIYHPHVTYVGDKMVDLIRMDEFVTQNNINIKEFNMLNIDVQGVELQVIESFGNMLENIDYILVEVNEAELYENGSLIGDIDRHLGAYGIIRAETYMTPYQWGDAFYIKRNLL
jgi:FkbM family methyltransferase